MAMTVAKVMTEQVIKLHARKAYYSVMHPSRSLWTLAFSSYHIPCQYLRAPSGVGAVQRTAELSGGQARGSVSRVWGGAHRIAGLHVKDRPRAARVALYTPKLSRKPRTVAMIRNADTAKRFSLHVHTQWSA